MAFAPEYKEINLQTQKTLHSESIVISNNIQTSGFIIKQVLSVSAVPTVNMVNCINGNADIAGVLVVKALVVNAEREYQVIEQENSFNVHLQDADITEGARLLAKADFVEVCSIAPTENSVSTSIKIIVNSVLIKPQTIKYVQNVGNLAYQKTEQNEFSNIINCITQNFDLSNEVNLPNNVSNILMTNAHCVLDDAMANADMITLKGKVYAQVVYLSNEEVPKLRSQEYVLDFNQEFLSNGTVIDDKIIASVDIIKSDCEVQGEMSSSKGVLVIKTSMVMNAEVVRNVQIENVVDAFCPNYALNLQSNVCKHQEMGSMQLDEKVDGSLSLPDDVRIDKILCVSTTYCMFNTMQSDNTMHLKGIVYANVIYQLDDDNATTGAILAEIPFEKELEMQTNDIMVHINVKEIEARSKRVKDIDIQADVNIMVNYAQNVNKLLINDVSLGDKEECCHKALGVYVVNNINEVWDIAKMLKVSPDVVLMQNPNITFPITKPTNIMIYRQMVQNS